MSVTDYQVSGLTCGHCVTAVTEELSALPDVTAVVVDLVADGVSTVHVTSNVPLPAADVAMALDEAGDYQLV